MAIKGYPQGRSQSRRGAEGRDSRRVAQPGPWTGQSKLIRTLLSPGHLQESEEGFVGFQNKAPEAGGCLHEEVQPDKEEFQELMWGDG